MTKDEHLKNFAQARAIARVQGIERALWHPATGRSWPRADIRIQIK